VNGSFVRGGSLCLTYLAYGVLDSPGATLVVLLHGDLSKGGPADYMAEYASGLAGVAPKVVAVAIARPGYGFANGNESEGSTNDRRDNYTAGNVAAIAEAITKLKQHFGAARTLVVGHSGGAAVAALMAGRHPTVGDAFVLVACPCSYLDWWRDRDKSGSPKSLDPSRYVEKIPATARIVAITGSEDDNTRPRHVESYIEELQERGIDARFLLAEGQGHSLLDAYWTSFVRPEVLKLLPQ